MSILRETGTIIVKFIFFFFDIFIHLEVQRYADGDLFIRLRLKCQGFV